VADENQTYEEWENMLLHHPLWRNSSWRSVGNWLYPSKTNAVYRHKDVVYHVCRANYDSLHSIEEGYSDSITGLDEGCHTCGDGVPDGIKMIMLLGKL
jgi:hypothetical protein